MPGLSLTIFLRLSQHHNMYAFIGFFMCLLSKPPLLTVLLSLVKFELVTGGEVKTVVAEIPPFSVCFLFTFSVIVTVGEAPAVVADKSNLFKRSQEEAMLSLLILSATVTRDTEPIAVAVK